MDQSMLATASPERLELLLKVLKESRLLTEAEAKKNEEIRRAKETDLEIERLRRGGAVPPRNADKPSTSADSGADAPGGSTEAPVAEPPLSSSSSYPHYPPGPARPFTFGFQTHGATSLTIPVSVSTSLFPSAPNMPATPFSFPPSSSAPLASVGNPDPPPPNAPFPAPPPTEPFSWLAELLGTTTVLPNPSAHSTTSSSYGDGSPAPERARPPSSTGFSSPGMATPKFPFDFGLVLPTRGSADDADEERTTQSPSLPPPPTFPTLAAAAQASAAAAATRRHGTRPIGHIDDDDLPPINLSKQSRRRRCRCYACDAPLCLLIFHGPDDALDIATPNRPNATELLDTRVLCAACYRVEVAGAGESGPTGTAALGWAGAEEDEATALPETAGGLLKAKTRKRRAKRLCRDSVMACEACSRRIGFGGVRVVEVGVGVGREEREEWVEPGFSVEPVYFCTQCGGGGAFRTGKWRPRQLFDHGRRTCSLPHKRMGDLLHFQVLTFRCPFLPLEDDHGRLLPSSTFNPEPVIERRDDIVMARVLAAFTGGNYPSSLELLRRKRKEIMALYRLNGFINVATAQVMADQPHLATWDKLVRRLDAGGRELDMLTLGGCVRPGTAEPLGPGDVRRHVCTVDALRTFKPPKRGRGDHPAEETEVLLSGFMFCQWDVKRRHVCWLHSTFLLREHDLDDPRAHSAAALAALVNRINREARVEKLAPPRHLWVLLYRSYFESGNPVVAAMQKLGMGLLGEYCRKWGLREEELKEGLEDFVFGKEMRERNVVMIMRWEDLKAPGIEAA
ncbi:hypothetical protein HDU96_005972 [Phlyctochytrium bullatum]|nr:hypothetical protein HDU96_005972 [Phlyctochytrium bullatum]